MLRRIDWYTDTGVSKELRASIFRVKHSTKGSASCLGLPDPESLNRRSLYTSRHGATSQKPCLFNNTAQGTLNLANVFIIRMLFTARKTCEKRPLSVRHISPFRSLKKKSCDRSVASSKASSPQSAI
jgi:hypothetical protein